MKSSSLTSIFSQDAYQTKTTFSFLTEIVTIKTFQYSSYLPIATVPGNALKILDCMIYKKIIGIMAQ